ncbi:hypothetical protein GCM10028805_08860 [Spirosoma harenae]
MRTSVLLCFAALGLLLNLSSCVDHRLGGTLSPVRLRLKTTDDGTTRTTYSYDSQNQPISITRNQVVNTIMYGDPQRIYTSSESEANHIFYITPSSSTPGQGEIVVYPPVLTNTRFTATRYNYSTATKIYYSVRLRYFDYTFDGSGRLTSYADRSDTNPDLNSYGYTYTGENITRQDVSTAGGHGLNYRIDYTHDDKINPFYGLWDPEIETRLRFTRNNMISARSQGLSSNDDIVYTYEYNQQGLPTKRTTVRNGVQSGVLTFTYESY